MTRQSFDKQWIGLVLGLVFPLLGIYIFYLVNDFKMSFDLFVTQAVEMHLTSKILSLGVLANLAIFFISIGLKLDKTARGVIGATLIYAGVILIFRFLV